MSKRTKPQVDLDETVGALVRVIRAHRGGILDRVKLVDLCRNAGIDARVAARIARHHAQSLYRGLGRLDGKTWVPEFTEPVFENGTISCRTIVSDDTGDDVVRSRQPTLSARAWRMLLHASAVDDELHLWEPWTKKGSRVPSLEDSLAAARTLIERGLCREGSDLAWIQITAEGRAFVEAQRERYSMLYPYVSLDAAGETVEQP